MILSLALLCCLTPCARAEETRTAYSNPDVPPPFAPEHEPAGDEYVTDAGFIGDSMMEYVELYDLIPTAHYVWKIGMSPGSVGHKDFRVKGSDQRLSGYEYAASYAPRKLYVWLGANGLDTSTSSAVLANYENLADRLVEWFPDALIYVISPPPTTYARMTEQDHVPVKRYILFEEALRELAARRHFYYIDMYHLVANEEGYLPNGYSMGDGYHLNEKALTIMTDYIRTHTVPDPAGADTEGEAQ